MRKNALRIVVVASGVLLLCTSGVSAFYITKHNEDSQSKTVLVLTGILLGLALVGFSAILIYRKCCEEKIFGSISADRVSSLSPEPRDPARPLFADRESTLTDIN